MNEPEHPSVHTLDLNFLGLPASIAAYLIPHACGAVLVECGPGSTLGALQEGLGKHGYTPVDITDVLLTHIHLDHGGAAGWWARQGARIHVHPVGAPHLIDPEKLLSSAQRIYGEQMEYLWGEFLPVPEDRLIVHGDGETIEIENLRVSALDTPGHAYHHLAYIFDDVCFTGDIGGIRMPGVRHLRLPMPPPEFNLELWRESVQKLIVHYESGVFKKIAPTHYGILDDAGWHLKALLSLIDELEAWMTTIMPANPSIEEINALFLSWTDARSRSIGLTDEVMQAFEAANPSWMSAAGIQRYWKKHRQRV